MNLRGVKSSCEVAVDARVAQSQRQHWIGDKEAWKTQGEVLKARARLTAAVKRQKTELVSHVSDADDDDDDDEDDDDDDEADDDDDDHDDDDPNETCQFRDQNSSWN